MNTVPQETTIEFCSPTHETIKVKAHLSLSDIRGFESSTISFSLSEYKKLVDIINSFDGTINFKITEILEMVLRKQLICEYVQSQKYNGKLRIDNLELEGLYSTMSSIMYNLTELQLSEDYSISDEDIMNDETVYTLKMMFEEGRKRNLVVFQRPTEKKQGYIYIIKLENTEYYKIGRTNNLDRRIKKFSIILPEPIIIIHSIESDNMVELEKKFHSWFSHRRTNGEWFRLTEKDIVWIKEYPNNSELSKDNK